MGKRNKNKKKKTLIESWDDYYFNVGSGYYAQYDSSNTKDINKIAIKVFGSLYYNP